MSEQVASGAGSSTPAPVQDGQGQPASGQPAAGKTFTQEELDRIISERLQREREKYKDYDALKQKAAEFDKLQESHLSEQEKLQKKLAELEREKESWQRERQERTLKYETMLTAIRVFAKRGIAPRRVEKATCKHFMGTPLSNDPESGLVGEGR